MLKSHVLSAAVAILLMSSGCASMEGATAGKSTLDRIKASKTITLGYRQSSVPFSSAASDGKPVGYSIDLCSRVADDLRKDLAMPDLAVKWVAVSPSRTGSPPCATARSISSADRRPTRSRARRRSISA